MYKEKWKFIAEAMEELSADHIIRYPRERDKKYKARKEIAYYINAIHPAVSLFVGYLQKHPPERDIPGDLLPLILDDCDKRNNDIDVFFSGFFKNAKARGCNLLLVDMPDQIPATKQYQIDQRAVPYFVEILPETVHSYKMNQFGDFEWIIIEEQVKEQEPFGKAETTTQYRYFDRQKWAIYDKDLNVTEQNEHNLGVCPVVALSETGKFPTLGEFSQIPRLSKRLMNLYSELDEILRSQTFSLLTMEQPAVPVGENETITISTDNALFFENNRPEFIAPPAGPAETYQKQIEKLENVIDKKSYMAIQDGVGESGKAKEYRFQALNNSLSAFAHKTEDFERKVWDIVCKWLNIPNETSVSYKKDFNIKDLMTEIEIANGMTALNIGKKYEAAKKKQLVSLDLESLENEDMQDIFDEIDDGAKEV